MLNHILFLIINAAKETYVSLRNKVGLNHKRYVRRDKFYVMTRFAGMCY